MTQQALYGIVAEFPTLTPIVAAAQELHRAGLRFIDAYTPYPVEELNELLGARHRWGIPLVTLIGTLLGAIASTFIQYWAAAIDYPLNIGGRPLNSWPAFTVSSFEFTLLFAIAGAFVAFLAASRLPLLYHPVFAATDFARASQDRFFLSIQASDPHFDAAAVRAILESHGAAPIDEVLA